MRLDAVGCVVLHADEADQPVARRLDLRCLDVEVLLDAEPGDGVGDQPVRAFPERLLYLPDADAPDAGLGAMLDDDAGGHVVGLARSPASMTCQVARPLGLPERVEDLRRRVLDAPHLSSFTVIWKSPTCSTWLVSFQPILVLSQKIIAVVSPDIALL